jgi:uncharacterized protein (DUF1697 family)
MAQLVAFLRGINVGGHTVKKENLQEIFTSLGFQNVSTFKQSGNIIFETPAEAEEVRVKLEEKLAQKLGFNTAVFIRTISQLKTIVKSEPFKGCNQEGASFLVTFLPNASEAFPLPLPATIPKSTAQVISAQGSEVYSVTHGGGEGALPNPFVESKLKLKTTTRNLNIIREIVEKYNKNASKTVEI